MPQGVAFFCKAFNVPSLITRVVAVQCKKFEKKHTGMKIKIYCNSTPLNCYKCTQILKIRITVYSSET